MKRLFERFAARATAKLRRSQIKLLYQNQHAADYLHTEQRTFLSAGLAGPEMIEDLQMMQALVSREIITLTSRDLLTDEEVSVQMQVNAALKNLYASTVEGRRRKRALTGEASGDLVPFASRFSPASGWDQISDAEWDRMISRALQ